MRTGIAALGGGLLVGCATNPVSGKKQFTLISEAGEIEIDHQNSPHQFSADFGVSQDSALNTYVTQVGGGMATLSHRPHMPYSFQVVNSPRINAYAFPGGTIAVTRGIMLAIQTESQLAAVLGHELGHVNARHTAERMSKGMLMQAVMLAASAYLAQSEYEEYAPVATGLGGLGMGMLLAKYSRDDERQADSLGLRYMVAAGHNPHGMSELMKVLMQMHNHKPGAIELMFASHPMSNERYETACEKTRTQYAAMAGNPEGRERFMDNTANLRAIGDSIDKMQQGDKLMLARKAQAAKERYAAALRQTPNDYTGLLLMANCCMAMNQYTEASRYAAMAHNVYPSEPQAEHVLGMIELQNGHFAEANSHFANYQQHLPGNPNTNLLNGLSLEGMNQTEDAALEYATYLQNITEGEAAQYAYQRLIDWGYITQ